ncbi:MAG: hypothetical protein L0228_11725 [Planctomycetes bacterium]|nr:hypothetical protein [Planctomycetota bacterium]
MSYVLIPYVVDISKLKSIVGSKVESLVEAVVAEASADFDEEDDDDQIDDELEEAIYQLIMGEEKYPVEADQFGYALKEICGYCGELLPVDIWNGVRWAAVEECGLEDLLTKTGPPIDLAPNSDFPTIGHIRRGEVNAYLQAARGRLEKSQDSEIRELLEEYTGWLETAAKKGLDVVFFYH